MLSLNRIMITGASGKLGKQIINYLSNKFIIYAPSREYFDITQHRYIKTIDPDLVIHCAAYTNVHKAEEEKEICYITNVIGTRNVARQSRRLIYISSDYVFDGEAGGYKETDPVNPSGYYGLTKALGEEAARVCADLLILRLSFKPEVWSGSYAPCDIYTSADFTHVIAEQVSWVVFNLNRIKTDILHLGTDKKTIYDLIKQKNKVLPLPISEFNKNATPKDYSLDLSLYKSLRYNNI